MPDLGVVRKPVLCPWCESAYSYVIDVRATPRSRKDRDTWSGDGLWRKRRCIDCRRAFTTEERVTGVYPPSGSHKIKPANIL